MTVSTEPTTLRSAITGWLDSFSGVTGEQNAGAVRSSLADICLDSHIVTYELPATLYDLYTEAGRRSEGTRVGTFTVAELVRIGRNALREL
jgi:hypothetical protein